MRPFFTPVPLDVLPEIRKLQAHADRVGKAERLLIGCPRKVQNEPPHRVGRAAAVVEQVLPGRVLVNGSVLPESREQVRENRLRDTELADRFAERLENRVARLFARIQGRELRFPIVQKAQGFRIFRYFIPQIVRPAAVRVQAEKVRAQRPGEKKRRDREILVMLTCERTAVLPRLLQRADGNSAGSVPVNQVGDGKAG